MNGNQDNKGTDYDFETAREEMNRARNPYAASYTEENLEIRRSSQYSGQMQSRKPRKKKVKFNWGTAVFVFIIATIIVFSAVRIARNKADAPGDTDITPQVEDDISTSEVTEPEEDTEPVEDTQDDNEVIYFSSVVSNDTLDEGDLVLVNYLYTYPEADDVKTVNAYNNRTAPFKVAGTDIELQKVAFNAFQDMVNDLNAATGCDDMIINSGYRTIKDQKNVYDYYLETKGEEYTKEYVADPGCSEHHTGLSCDLSFYLDEGYSEPIGEHEHGPWVTENCTDYGFVIRYPADKVSVTKIAHEAWHFRYVGIPHAKAMKDRNYCLEEYIDFLKDYSIDGKVLYVSADGNTYDTSLSAFAGTDGWVIYYVPEAEGKTTDVPVWGDENASYEISGNNVDGYIVTVAVG